GALGDLVARAGADGVAALQAAVPAEAGPVAYVNARLIDGSGAPAVAGAAVVTDGGKIVAARPRAQVAIPAAARTAGPGGQTLLPGLWDMHAHYEQVEWGPLYLAAGVTTVRDCGNELQFVGAIRDAIDAGKGVGPRILLACIVDGSGPSALGP